MAKVSETSPKSIIKKCIRNIDKRKIYSFSTLFDFVKPIIDYEREQKKEKKPSVSSIIRRYFEAKAELKKEFEFVSVEKKSAENWFKIVRK